MLMVLIALQYTTKKNAYPQNADKQFLLLFIFLLIIKAY